MRKFILGIALLLGGLASVNVLAQETKKPLQARAGYLAIEDAIDLGKIKPKMQVYLPRIMLRAVAADAIKQQPDLAQAIDGVELVRLLAFEGEGGSELEEGLDDLLNELSSSWQPLVLINDGAERVAVYVADDESGEKLAGMALVVSDGSDAIVANIMGDLQLNSLMKLGGAIAGDHLKPEMLAAILEQSGLRPPTPPAPPAPPSPPAPPKTPETPKAVPQAPEAPATEPPQPPEKRAAPTRPGGATAAPEAATEGGDGAGPE